jgi:hypothetical protein
MRRRAEIAPKEWLLQVGKWALAHGVRPPPNNRIGAELDAWIEQAEAGSARHARGVLTHSLRKEVSDLRLMAYLERARQRYNADPDRKHRGMERSLLLLSSARSPCNDRATPEAIEEAALMYEQLRRDDTGRGAAKRALAEVAAQTGVSRAAILRAIQKAQVRDRGS